jgi:hypothetical protein
VQEVCHHHETELAVLVCLGSNESVTIRHGDRISKTLLETFQLVQIGNGIDTTTSDGIVVSSDASHHGNARIRRVHHGVHKQANHEKVTEKVDLHGLFVIVDTPLGVGQRRLVDTSVANETIQGLAESELVHVFAKLPDRAKAVELAVHGRKVIHVKSVDFGDSLHLVEIANGANDMVLSRVQQGETGLAAET